MADQECDFCKQDYTDDENIIIISGSAFDIPDFQDPQELPIEGEKPTFNREPVVICESCVMRGSAYMRDHFDSPSQTDKCDYCGTWGAQLPSKPYGSGPSICILCLRTTVDQLERTSR